MSVRRQRKMLKKSATISVLSRLCKLDFTLTARTTFIQERKKFLHEYRKLRGKRFRYSVHLLLNCFMAPHIALLIIINKSCFVNVD